jgi:hypothetical protein
MASEKAPIVNTQLLSKKMPMMRKQRMASREDARLPGERGIKGAGGPVKEGSFRMYSEEMDKVFGTKPVDGMTVLEEPRL